jgi:glycosyltransferase involved in cell wall biosynthesis
MAGVMKGLENEYRALIAGRAAEAQSYLQWIATCDTLSEPDRLAICDHIERLAYRPLISVIMPVYNTPERFLRGAIDSVMAQLYEDWELCIANDASTSPTVWDLLDEYAGKDPRIKVVHRPINGHISAASNSAIALADGEFIALLDHDDELAEDALYRVAVELNHDPDVDIVYSDEDKIDENGVRFDPHFKSAWNPDLLWSHNYVSHFGVYRASLVRAVGGFRTGFEGAQDYDLLLRCVSASSTRSYGALYRGNGEAGKAHWVSRLRGIDGVERGNNRTGSDKDDRGHATPRENQQGSFGRHAAHASLARIRHIPAILYHWRAVAGSTAKSEHEKAYASAAGARALAEFFAGKADIEDARRKSMRAGLGSGSSTIETPDTPGIPECARGAPLSGITGVIVEAGPATTTYRVRFPVPEPAPKVSLIIPTRNGYATLSRCVASICEKTSYPRYEIVIVDNQSDDPCTLEYLHDLEARHAARVLRYDHPFNYSAINNFAVDHAGGDVIGLVNDDIEVIAPDWLTEMLSQAIRPDIGAVGAKLYYPDGRLQHGGVIVGLGGVAGHSHKHYPREASGHFHRLSLVQNLSAVTGACLLVRRQIYKAVGGLDEKNLAIAFNDVDFCLRLREAGYRNLWTPYAELYHHESASRGPEDTPAKQARFAREVGYMKARWGKQLLEDPYYSPNLTLDREDFSIAFGQRTPKPWLDVGSHGNAAGDANSSRRMSRSAGKTVRQA